MPLIELYQLLFWVMRDNQNYTPPPPTHTHTPFAYTFTLVSIKQTAHLPAVIIYTASRYSIKVNEAGKKLILFKVFSVQ